ncbi:MAG: type I-E CRISPR-associated protein Cse1/CasA [Desulfofustis sp. PB-SRB1]|jgi:CRISPR system Cascade subunit CasA|nr:type I-E CRISPR-associated protein Cse1/CasA [Desulfofustis sp. PB-SRB1]
MENRFNLIDEPWIPVADVGRVSLRQVFTNFEYRTLGGNPVEKIALMKLLLAIGQAATELPDEQAWQALDEAALAAGCIAYLEKWHDRFYLYGERPFLQMPAISVAQQQRYGAVLPEVATGNTTVLSQFNQERELLDADKALLLVLLMGFSMGGKKTDNSVVLTRGYKGKSNPKGKPSTGKPGPSLGFMGLLHSFVNGKTILQSIRLNLLVGSDLRNSEMFSSGLGFPPWESMPAGEDCKTAQELKQSYMGRLVPLSRFCLMSDKGLHYSEGLAHMNYQEGIVDPTVAMDATQSKIKVLWSDPEKRPWRQLPALLSFIEHETGTFDCLQLRKALPRARRLLQNFAVWSGGLRVSSNAGEQYVSGTDDFVESEVWLESNYIDKIWFGQLQQEMRELENISKKTYGCIRGYYTALKAEGDKLASQGTSTFWQLCESNFQALVDSCDQGTQAETERRKLRKIFAAAALNTYDHFCPNDTARQLDGWAQFRPNFSNYLKREEI